MIPKNLCAQGNQTSFMAYAPCAQLVTTLKGGGENALKVLKLQATTFCQLICSAKKKKHK